MLAYTLTRSQQYDADSQQFEITEIHNELYNKIRITMLRNLNKKYY